MYIQAWFYILQCIYCTGKSCHAYFMSFSERYHYQWYLPFQSNVLQLEELLSHEFPSQFHLFSHLHPHVTPLLHLFRILHHYLHKNLNGKLTGEDLDWKLLWISPWQFSDWVQLGGNRSCAYQEMFHLWRKMYTWSNEKLLVLTFAEAW